MLIEGVFGIKGFNVAVTAAKKNPNHRLGFRGKKRLTIGRSPDLLRFLCKGAADTIAPKHRAERQAGETHADIGEKSAAGKTSTFTAALWRSVHDNSEYCVLKASGKARISDGYMFASRLAMSARALPSIGQPQNRYD